MPIRSYSRYVLVILSVSVVFTAIVLVALSAWMNQPEGKGVLSGLGASDTELQAAYKKGYDAARERFQNMGLTAFDSGTKTMAGTVVRAGSSSIVVMQTSLDTDPVADNVPNERTVSLAANAKVYKEASKTPAQLEAELNATLNDQSATPPSTVVRREIKLSDIPAGATVRIVSADPVRLAKNISATEIVWSVSTP